MLPGNQVARFRQKKRPVPYGAGRFLSVRYKGSVGYAGIRQLTDVYPYALRTRKSAGLMTRKLSVTELQKTAQFFGTSTRRKCRTDRQKSL